MYRSIMAMEGSGPSIPASLPRNPRGVIFFVTSADNGSGRAKEGGSSVPFPSPSPLVVLGGGGE